MRCISLAELQRRLGRLAEARTNCVTSWIGARARPSWLTGAVCGHCIRHCGPRRGSTVPTSRPRTRAPDFPDLRSPPRRPISSYGPRCRKCCRFRPRARARARRRIHAQSDRLFVLNRFKLLSRSELFEEHRRWGANLEAQVASTRRPHNNTLDPDRRLRIGYVSADLRNHAVAHFLEGVLPGSSSR